MQVSGSGLKGLTCDSAVFSSDPGSGIGIGVRKARFSIAIHDPDPDHDECLGCETSQQKWLQMVTGTNCNINRYSVRSVPVFRGTLLRIQDNA